MKIGDYIIVKNSKTKQTLETVKIVKGITKVTKGILPNYFRTEVLNKSGMSTGHYWYVYPNSYFTYYKLSKDEVFALLI